MRTSICAEEAAGCTCKTSQDLFKKWRHNPGGVKKNYGVSGVQNCQKLQFCASSTCWWLGGLRKSEHRNVSVFHWRLSKGSHPDHQFSLGKTFTSHHDATVCTVSLQRKRITPWYLGISWTGKQQNHWNWNWNLKIIISYQKSFQFLFFGAYVTNISETILEISATDDHDSRAFPTGGCFKQALDPEKGRVEKLRPVSRESLLNKESTMILT